LVIGDWAQPTIPNPQSPIPNPQLSIYKSNHKQILLNILKNKKCQYY